MPELRLLVVDDDPAILRTLSRLLRARGVVADTAASPEEARQVASRLREEGVAFDRVLSDVDLGDESGFDFVAALRAAGEAPRSVLFMSGLVSYARRVQALELGEALLDKFDLHAVADAAAAPAVVQS